MHENHRDFLRIFWQKSPVHELSELRLCTVTYGIASAPFLAVRSMQQCATDYLSTYPVAHDVVKSDFYVDDMITGAHTEQEGIQIVQQVTEMLNCGGFLLSKWISNNNINMESISPEKREMEASLPISVGAEQSMKTLGIIWHPSTDELVIR